MNYAIKEETLTALGDVIRKEKGETRTTILNLDKEFEVVAIGSKNQPCYKIPTSVFDGYIEVVIKWQAPENTENNASYAVAGEQINGGYKILYGALGKHPVFTDFEQDITIAFDKLYNPEQGYKTDYVYIFKFDNHINNYISITVKNTYTLEEMVNVVNDFIVIPDDFINLTGDCRQKFAYNAYNWMLNKYSDKITTNNLTSISGMFYESDELTNIPFQLNVNGAYANQLFSDCSKLTTIPYIVGSIKSLGKIFYNCERLREIPEDWADKINWNILHNSTTDYAQGCFYCCYSLRKIPQNLIENIYVKLDDPLGGHLPYSYQYYYCYVLGEVDNIPVLSQNTSIGLTNQAFRGMFEYCNRLKHITFQTNSDGTPIVARWKSQTIDLSTYVGYARSVNNITGYNSGLTTATQITDQASYEALKDNPDNWTNMVEYSRYNHDSAVETINSLPDASAYLATTTGTNTINFEGASGSLTDGGAINTLTPEEIAVATAKGWTVSLS